MTKMLELLYKKFKVIMTNVLKALMEIWNNMQIRGLVSVEGIETIRKGQMEVLELKKHSVRDEKCLPWDYQ